MQRSVQERMIRNQSKINHYEARQKKYEKERCECESEDNMLFYTAKTNLVNYLNHGKVYFVKDVADLDKEAVFILPDNCEMK